MTTTEQAIKEFKKAHFWEIFTKGFLAGITTAILIVVLTYTFIK